MNYSIVISTVFGLLLATSAFGQDATRGRVEKSPESVMEQGSIYDGLKSAPGSAVAETRGGQPQLRECGGQAKPAAGRVSPLGLDCGMCSGHYMQSDGGRQWICQMVNGQITCRLNYAENGGTTYSTGSQTCYLTNNPCDTCRNDILCQNWN